MILRRLGSLLCGCVIVAGAVATADADAPTECAPPPGKNPYDDPAVGPPKDAEAARHMKDGNKALRADDYDTALLEYQAGARIESAPVFFYDLGQTYRLSGRYKEAIRQYTLFLHRGQPGPVLRDLVECHVRMMKAELERAAMTEPPVDPPPDDQQSASARPVRLNVDDAGADEPERSGEVGAWYTDGVGWGVVGAGAVATGVGVFLFVKASNLDADAETEDRESARQDLLDRAASHRTWGTAATIIGVAGIAVGVVKLALTPDARSQEQTVSIEVAPSYIGLAGRF
jgi:hypothetical protein